METTETTVIKQDFIDKTLKMKSANFVAVAVILLGVIDLIVMSCWAMYMNKYDLADKWLTLLYVQLLTTPMMFLFGFMKGLSNNEITTTKTNEPNI